MRRIIMESGNPLFTTIQQIETHYQRRDLTDFALNQNNELVPKTTLQKISSLFSTNQEVQYDTLKNTLKGRVTPLNESDSRTLAHAPKEKFILYSFYFPEIVQSYLERFKEETGVKVNVSPLTGEQYSQLEDLREELKTTNVMWEIIDQVIPRSRQEVKVGEGNFPLKITEQADYQNTRKELLENYFTKIDDLNKTVDALNEQLRYSLGQSNQSDMSVSATTRLTLKRPTEVVDEKKEKAIKEQIAKLKKLNPHDPVIKEHLNALNPTLDYKVHNVVHDHEKVKEYLSFKDDLQIIDDFVNLHLNSLFVRYVPVKTESGKLVTLKLEIAEDALKNIMKKVNALGFRETPANYKYRSEWVFDPTTSIAVVEKKQKDFAEFEMPRIINAKFPHEKIVKEAQMENVDADLQALDIRFAAEAIEKYNNQLKSWLSGNWKSTEFDRHYEDAVKLASPKDEQTLRIFNEYKKEMEQTIDTLFFAKNRCINRQFFSKKTNQK